MCSDAVVQVGAAVAGVVLCFPEKFQARSELAQMDDVLNDCSFASYFYLETAF